MILYRSLLWTALVCAAAAFVFQSPVAAVAGMVIGVFAFTAKALA